MFRCGGSAVALNPQCCPAPSRTKPPRLDFRSLLLHCSIVSKVHSQGERYVQQGSSIAVTGQAGGKNGSNSNWLREIGAGAKFWHSNPVCCGAPKPLALPLAIGARDSCRGCARSLIGSRPSRIGKFAWGRGTCRTHASGRTQRSTCAA